jgi:hypothetical protein
MRGVWLRATLDCVHSVLTQLSLPYRSTLAYACVVVCTVGALGMIFAGIMTALCKTGVRNHTKTE